MFLYRFDTEDKRNDSRFEPGKIRFLKTLQKSKNNQRAVLESLKNGNGRTNITWLQFGSRNLIHCPPEIRQIYLKLRLRCVQALCNR